MQFKRNCNHIPSSSLGFVGRMLIISNYRYEEVFCLKLYDTHDDKFQLFMLRKTYDSFATLYFTTLTIPKYKRGNSSTKNYLPTLTSGIKSRIKYKNISNMLKRALSVSINYNNSYISKLTYHEFI